MDGREFPVQILVSGRMRVDPGKLHLVLVLVVVPGTVVEQGQSLILELVIPEAESGGNGNGRWIVPDVRRARYHNNRTDRQENRHLQEQQQ